MTKNEQLSVLTKLDGLRTYVSFEDQYKIDELEGNVADLLSYIHDLETKVARNSSKES